MLRAPILGTVLLIGVAVGCKSAPTQPSPPAAKKPATTPMPATVPNALYHRLGGEKAIRAVVDEFVARGAADPNVNFTRKGTGHEWAATPGNVEKLKVGLTQFIMSVTGGPPHEYKGKDLVSVHKGMQITNAEFDALVADLKAAMDKLNVPQREQVELMSVVVGTRGAIVEK